MTEEEQRKLLNASGEHADTFRDHVIFSVALGTALRQEEILSLNVGDVYGENGSARRRVDLKVFKGSEKDDANVEIQRIFLPDSLRYKLKKFRAWKKRQGESLEDDAPLFCGAKGKSREPRLGARRLRDIFADWQTKAGFDRSFSFHALRHTSLTNLYRKTRDIRLVQQAARHANIETTTIYAQASDEDLLRATRDVEC